MTNLGQFSDEIAVCYDTRIATLEPGAVSGGQVTTIGPLNIAYRDGGQSTVYLKFPTTEDRELLFVNFPYLHSMDSVSKLTPPLQ